MVLFCQAAAQHTALAAVRWAAAPLAAYLAQSVRLALAAVAVATAAAASRWVSLRWAARLVVADSRRYDSAWRAILTKDDGGVGGGDGAMEEALALRMLIQVLSDFMIHSFAVLRGCVLVYSFRAASSEY